MLVSSGSSRNGDGGSLELRSGEGFSKGGSLNILSGSGDEGGEY